MAEYLTVARPYARALLLAALEKKALSEWQDMLNVLASLVQVLTENQLIGNPALSDQRLYSLCWGVLQDVISIRHELLQEAERFIQLLLMEKRLRAVPDIARMYHQLAAAHNKLIDVEVISATVLTTDQQEQLVASLERRFDSKVIIDYSHDLSLIGGLVIKSDNWVFDGSIRSKLLRLIARII